MNATTQILCSFALTFGVPVMIAGWELWRLGPSSRHFPPGEPTCPQPPPLPDADISPRVTKALPDCLVPRAVPARVRELV
jgi:hypothetical protein